MKKIWAFLFLLFVVTSIFGQPYLAVHGWGVDVQVDTNGYFGVGTYPGELRLTYEYRYPDLRGPSSSIAFKIDGADVFAWPITVDCFHFPLKPRRVPGYPLILPGTNAIEMKWKLPVGSTDTISVGLYMTPVPIVAGYDSFGMIEFRYRIRNDGIMTHTVQVEHKYDVMLNASDGAPVVFPFTGEFLGGDTNLFFDGWIPWFINSFEYYIFSTGLKTMSIFVNSVHDHGPELVAFGDEYEIIPSCFNLDTSFAGTDYDYSAEMLKYPTYAVLAGEAIDLVTYYGLSTIRYSPAEDFTLGVIGYNWSLMHSDFLRIFQCLFQNNTSYLLDSLWVCVDFDASVCSLTTLSAERNCYLFTDFPPSGIGSAVWGFVSISDTFAEANLAFTCSTNTAGVATLSDTFLFLIPESWTTCTDVAAGWNLVSNPSPAAIPSSSVSSLPGYYWDNPARSYIESYSIEPKKGYWAMNFSPVTLCEFGGMSVYDDTLYPGWNLIGAPDHSTFAFETRPPGLIIGYPYAWDDTLRTYYECGIIRPGRAYWVLSSGHGRIIVGE